MTTTSRTGTTPDQHVLERFAAVVGSAHVVTEDRIGPDYHHDEALAGAPVAPRYLARPATAEETAELLVVAAAARVPVTARGSGTGLSGACRPVEDGLVISFERMATVLEVDVDNQVAVVQPGVTLAELDAAVAPYGLMYTVFPGELSASVGGTVGTNAGGMRAVRYGVTRHNVLGLQAALPSGELVRTGGKLTKVSTGYDLTQLIMGSEGTLALATEITVRLYPRPAHSATLMAAFADLTAVMRAVPAVLRTGVAPTILEYLDTRTLEALTRAQDLELGIGTGIRAAAQAYLVIGLDDRERASLDTGIDLLGELLDALGALDIYVLEGYSARLLIEAREKAFWSAKASGADEVLDVVVPRAAMPEFFDGATALAHAVDAQLIGCGHAGDGNVHLAVYCREETTRDALLHRIFALATGLGGAISGEHGLGRIKTAHFTALADPVALALMRGIKQVFDPAGILNPGVILGGKAVP
ncbi:FAD-binding oxidoreductase [Nocardia bhagyanarayanae]|uniref:Glycolate oxidase n=1 Tax=Nocardia bhagyanarayanae TaxID=1215925 RepID=A0A543EXW7_9NOCA|nr:FAD-linked oxidase C-terminal domain-containing protein [Nocardia bhagyanarayanae]TQM26430.1 glycolate oxidase [Nocardia bhagyanarayanae]